MKVATRALLAAALLVAAPAPAVEFAADHGFGEVLLFPYFTAKDRVDEDFATVLTLSGRGKGADTPAADAIAVRVAVRSPSVDGSAVPPLLVNLLLRGNDSWTLAANRGMAFSADASCAMVGDAGAPADLHTGGPLPGEEGWIEVFELGRVTATEVIERLDRADRAAACAEIAALLPTLAVGDWLAAPDNRLRGTAHLVSVATGTSFTVQPVVLRDFRDAPVYAPASEDSPTLADARPARADVVLSTGARRSASFASRPIDAVSAVLMSTEWDLDYNIAPELGARTDVVLTLPTRRWYVGDAQALAPFQHPTRAGGAFEVNALVFDREGSGSGLATAKCTPPFAVPALGPVIDRDLVTLRLADDSAFHDPDARPLTYAAPDSLGCAIGGLVPNTLVEGGYESGRMTLQFVDGPRAPGADSGFGRLVSDEGHVFLGVPAIGAAATSVVNADVGPGLLAHYGVGQPIARRTASVEEP